MKAVMARTLFSVRDREYSGKDVVLAAMIRSDWKSFEDDVRERIACARADEENEEDFEEEIESAAAKFRYDHNLVAADDLTTWLDEREIDVEEWLAYIHRSLLAEKWSHQIADILAKYPVTDKDLEQATECDAICSGTLRRFSDKLAGRSAIYLKKEDPDLSAEFQAQRIGIQPGDIRLREIDPEDFQHLLQLEEFFQWYSNRSLTEEAIRNHIHSYSLDWTQFRFKYLSFPREEIAQEAALCVKEDGLDFDNVGEHAKTKATEKVCYYAELDDPLKDLFLVAQKGSLIGPVRLHDRFSLFQILERSAPTDQDPEITKQAKGDLLQKIVDREITDQVHWHFRF